MKPKHYEDYSKLWVVLICYPPDSNLYDHYFLVPETNQEPKEKHFILYFGCISLLFFR